MDPETDTTSNYDEFDHNDHLIGTFIGQDGMVSLSGKIFQKILSNICPYV